MVNFFLKFSLESKDGKLLHNGERGKLVVEGAQDIPFEIKRVFYIYGSDNEVVRGKHANKESEFVLINVAGKSKVRVTDGIGEHVVELNRARCREFIFQKWSGKTCMIFRRTQFFLLLQARTMMEMNISATMMNT